MGDYEIHEIQDSDTNGVVDLCQRAGLIKPRNDPLSDIARSCQSPGSTILVLFHEERLIATAMVGEYGHRGWLYFVAVDPRRQMQGFGGAIINAAERWLASRGAPKVSLLARRNNEAAVVFYCSLEYGNGGNTCLEKALEPLKTGDGK